jgi:hypothetical protein
MNIQRGTLSDFSPAPSGLEELGINKRRQKKFASSVNFRPYFLPMGHAKAVLNDDDDHLSRPAAV